MTAGNSLINRAGPQFVALETTLLIHGVPRAEALPLARDLNAQSRAGGAESAVVGILNGDPIVGMCEKDLIDLIDAVDVPKANAANLGLLMHRKASAATTVSATMELASKADVRIFATGAIGGVHKDYGRTLDISADLAALSKYPMAVVSSGVKSILDVVATRESLESLGVPVVGFQTDRFPCFYQRTSDAIVDARFDDVDRLASFLDYELKRRGRGVLVANPIPIENEISEADWRRWLGEATDRVEAENVVGRDVTPALLGALHEVSGGATIKANIALVRDNARLAGAICAAMQN